MNLSNGGYPSSVLLIAWRERGHGAQLQIMFTLNLPHSDQLFSFLFAQIKPLAWITQGLNQQSLKPVADLMWDKMI